ncbi:unnamed protein product [Blepharisma stoltei]|uniref:WD repeat-containing protein on Y chromosome n=1 Tax=Blepharisma stoltei TaxID=1481888 RepID=A0AAU9K300_9CILI|nr:unnamed protein product [Blepharisma stoltei]
MDKRYDMPSLNDISVISSGRSPAMNDTLNKIIEQFTFSPQGRGGNTVFPLQDEPDDYEEYDQPQSHIEQLQPSAILSKSVFAKKIRQNIYKDETFEEEETIESQIQADTNNVDLNNIMNSGRLMRLKLDMDKFPDQALGIEDFVVVMKEVIADQIKIDDEILVSQLIDNFYRIDVHNTGKVSFDMVSSYLIEQEIMMEMGKDRTLTYRPSQIIDESRHDNYIDKLFYFPSIDKIGVMEQNLRALKIYNANNLRCEYSLMVKTGIALASEYIQEFHVIILSSSDKSMLFFHADSHNLLRRIMVPDSQHTMFWSHEHQTLFSAGMEGAIYGWNVDEILNPDIKSEEIPYFDVIAKGMPWKDGDECIFHIVELTAMQQIAAACADKKIRIWDIRWESNTKPRKILQGHIKAIRYLAYSYAYNLLISCGFEFDALVWNPYVSEPICHLKGHESPLTGVECPEINPTIVTADSKGVIKIWNIKDYSLIQTFYVNVLKLKAIKSIPKHRRLIAASRKLQVFDYEKPFIPEISDDSPIFCAKYSSQQLQIFIAGQHSIKVWNCITGRPIKLISDIFINDITSLILDESDRKIIVGDHSGRIVMVDSLSGVILKEFCSHSEEVTGMVYVAGDRLLITCSWDKKIMIHNDNLKGGFKEKRRGVVRSISNAHSNDITCIAYSSTLDLIYSGSRDCQIRVWDYETCKLEAVLLGHHSDILIVLSLDPYPMILVSDQGGNLSIWGISCPNMPRFQCLVKWRNMHTLEKTATITAATHYCLDNALRIVLGDEKGTIRLLEVKDLLTELNISPYHKESPKLKSRNPTRLADLDMQDTEKTHKITFMQRKSSESSLESEDPQPSNELEFVAKPLKEDHYVRQVIQWRAHNDAIKHLSYISELTTTGVFSTGLDHMAKLWTINGESLGVLKQGSRVPSDWNFDVKEEVKSRKQIRARNIMNKIANLPNSTKRFGTSREVEGRSGFKKLNTRLTEDNPPLITAAEMLKNINEVEKLMPKDNAYENLKESRGFKPKKSKRNY